MKYFILSLLLLLCTAASAMAHGENGYIIKVNLDDERIVDIDDKNVISRDLGIYMVNSKDELDIFCDSYDVEKYQPDCEVQLFDAPNDTYYTQRWDASVLNLPDMWDYDIDASDVTVAVLDTGITQNHKDFNYDNIEIGYNMCAALEILADGNNPDNEQYAAQVFDVGDDIGHGTNVAGIIGSVCNNKKGSFGICDDAKLKIYKVYSANCNNVSCILAALTYIYERAPEVDVINLSIGFQTGGIVQDVIDKLAERGVIIVAAAGNGGADTLNYPAGCEKVIGVGAVSACHQPDDCTQVCTCTDVIGTPDISALKVTSFSQHNKSVDVVAPGRKLLTANPDNSYAYVSGTSFSAPYVAAIAAMVKSIDKSIGHDEFLALLRQTSLDRGEVGYDEYYGWGIIQPSAIADTLADKYGVMLLSENDVVVSAREKSYTIKRRGRDYKIYAVKYGENGEITDVEIKNISGGDGEVIIDFESIPDKLFCWDTHMQPLFGL